MKKQTLPSPKQTKRPTLGVLLDDLSLSWSWKVWRGMVAGAQAHDANLICFLGSWLDAPEPAKREENVIYKLASREILDGLALHHGGMGTYLSVSDFSKFLQQYKPLPMVSIEDGPADLPTVGWDAFEGMRKVMVHLIEVHGRRRIVFVGGLKNNSSHQERYRAYVETLKEYDIPLDPRLVFEVGQSDDVVQDLLDNRKLQPKIDFDAMTGYNDAELLRFLAEFQARCIRVPSDVALVGFDDNLESQLSTLPLTSLRPPNIEVSQMAAELLLAIVDGQSVPERSVLSTQLIIRQSCGCMSPAVIEAGSIPHQLNAGQVVANLSAGPSAQLREAWDQASHQEVTVAMAQASGDANATEQMATLLEAFFDELIGSIEQPQQGSRNFIAVLNELLTQAIVDKRKVGDWQHVISVLQNHSLPFFAQQTQIMLIAQALWQQARVLIGEAIGRMMGTEKLAAEQYTNALRQIGEELITTFDVDGLMNVLADQLPRLGFTQCYLSLYDNPQAPMDGVRLILAYNENGRIELGPGGQPYPAQQLVPSGMLPEDRSYSLAVLPLSFQLDRFGFVVFETNQSDGKIFATLRNQISSALQGALLVQRVEERSLELARQQYILDTFMESVPDRIYFKDAQGHITRANRALAMRIGVQDSSELVGKSDFDFFSASEAEVKFQQEQEIIKTGQPILDLEEPDGIDHWVLTTKMPLRDEKGAIIGTFGISTDITELVKVKQAAEIAREEADKARGIAEMEKERAEGAKNEAEKAHHEVEIANRNLAAQIWQTTGQAQLNEKMRGEQDIPTLAHNVIQQLCKYLGVDNGAMYILEDKILRLTGTYAFRRKSLVKEYQLGEGRVGQAAEEKEINLNEIPDDYIALSLRQGKLLPKYSLVAPVVYNQEVSGVITLESLTEFGPAQMGFLEKAIESVAIAFMTAQARTRVNELFAQTRQQAEELQAQEEELRATNEELEAQTESLRASETRLKTNQTALEAANVELEEKSHILQEKQTALDHQNQILRDAQQELERRAEELTITNKYKSEFLANMSHELRTPLNSLLILSRMLANNEGGNLTSDQVESAQVIYTSGADLLELINEILDLSRVEAGHMTFNFAPMPFTSLAQSMHSQFAHVAEQKNLKFEITLGSGLPESITTDQQRVEQVLKNLLSNAFKFTEKGAIQLGIETEGEMIALHVRDSGIGMTPEQQERVFEAFQQADGSTSRKYGGTGLGLTISREMAAKLGGKIGVKSKPGKGSVFTLYLPLFHVEGEVAGTPAPVSTAAAPLEQRPAPAAAKASAPDRIPEAAPRFDDDRNLIKAGDKILLVIEDDPKFAKVLFNYAHKKTFKCLLTGDGESGLKLATIHHPDAILLDLKLPGISGWDVLDTLKEDASLRHIPVHILSASDQTMDAYKHGALGFLSKPISQAQLDGVFATIGEFLSREIKSLLIVEDDSGLRHSVGQLLGGSDVKISEAASGKAALALLRKMHFDCMILDLTLPDMTGFELLGKINQDDSVSKCPIIVYTGKALTEEENAELLKYASSVIIKGVKSPERLLDETALFLHRVVADMPAEKQDTIRRLHDRDAVFSGKHLLVVDDNMRNAFALSRLLNDRGLQVTIASSGEKALESLESIPGIDLVLMDIMMPGMDGYETMKKVRAKPKFKHLPILALTAKAMKGDREKCIAAGANDYLSKPIDSDRLFSMLRVWLYG